MTRARLLPDWSLILLRIAVLTICAVLLWHAVNWREALHLLKQADLGWLGAAVLLLTVQTCLSAQRWRITAAQLGISIAPLTALREYYLSQVVNQSIPGGVVGDAGRAVRARDQAGLFASGQAVVFERLAGQLGLIAILIPGLAITLVFPGLQDWPNWLVAPVSVGMASAAAVVFGVYAVTRLSHPVALLLQRSTVTFRHAVTGRSVWRQQSALSLATAVCNIAAFACCAAALGIPLPFLAAITLVPLILFAMVLPLSVGGWGLREGVAAILFPAIGASMIEGLATSVAFGIVLLISVLPGILIGLASPKPTEKPTGTCGGLRHGAEQ